MLTPFMYSSLKLIMKCLAKGWYFLFKVDFLFQCKFSHGELFRFITWYIRTWKTRLVSTRMARKTSKPVAFIRWKKVQDKSIQKLCIGFSGQGPGKKIWSKILNTVVFRFKHVQFKEVSLSPKWKNRLSNVWFKEDFWFKEVFCCSQKLP